jgi:hypothetical protein
MSEDSKSGFLKRLPLPEILFSLGLGAASTLNRLVDPDLFWHLRAGKDILAAGHPVLPDSWTYLFAGHPWVNQQWLTQIFMYKAYDWGGYGGLQVLKALVVAAIAFVLLLALRKHPPLVRYVAGALFVACNSYYLLFRTHVFSFLGMAALYFVLERLQPRARLAALMLLFAIWANVHAFFGIGLGVLGLYTAAQWIQRFFKAPGPWQARLRATANSWEFAALPLSALATLLNPFGVGVWKTAFSVIGSRETTIVTEWAPLWKASPYVLIGFLPLLLLVIIYVAMMRSRADWSAATPALVLAAMAVMSVRFLPVFTLPALLAIAPFMAGLGDKVPAGWRSRIAAILPPVATAVLSVVAAAAIELNVALPVYTPSRDAPLDYPVEAVQFMKTHDLNGRIFNRYAWGGYLVWELPESRIFIDPRTGVLLFPDGYLKAWRECFDAKPGWEKTLERGNPDFVLTSPTDYLDLAMRSEPGWKVIYSDALSTLFARK